MESKLYAAVTSGDLKLLTKLQSSGINILQEVTPTGNTALHLAAYHGHVNIVKLLLQLINRDIEAGNHNSGHEFLTARNEEGNTAFHEAAIGGHCKVIEVLLDFYRHDLQNIINDAGETALFKAVEEGHEKVVTKLLPSTLSQHDKRTSDGQTLVHCAVYNRRKEVLKKVIAAKPDLLKQADNLGRTPLHYAAYLNRISDIAKILLEKDKSLCYKVDRNEQSALHIAAKEGNLDLVTEILKYAKDCIEIRDNEGRNALHLVIQNALQIFDKISRRIKTLVLLVISKRLINKADNGGKMPLDIALDNMHTDERLFNGIKWLLEINGARRTVEVMHNITEFSVPTEKSTWKVQIISVNAVLIATVAFAAAFTLPVEHKSDKLYRVFFQIMVVSDAVAFCSSISSAILLMYALYGKQEDPLLLDTSLTGLWTALISLLLAFGAGIFVAVAPDHKIVAGIVLAVVIMVPIWIRIMILRSKKYIFREDVNYLRCFLITVVVQTILTFVSKSSPKWGLVMVLGIGLAFIGLRRYLSPKENICRGDEHYLWIFIWYSFPTVFLPLTLAQYGIGGTIWLIVGIGAYIGRKIYFRAKQEIYKDDDHYVWVLTFIIGVIIYAANPLLNLLFFS